MIYLDTYLDTLIINIQLIYYFISKYLNFTKQYLNFEFISFKH